MKKIVLPFIFSFFCTLLFSQTTFQGKVTHKFTSTRDDETGTIEVFYGNQKIKGVKKTGAGKLATDDDLIIDFSKGIAYFINHVTKTYGIDSLKTKALNTFPSIIKETGKTKVILNYACTAFHLDSAKRHAFPDNVSIRFWYTDSLNFFVDEQYLRFEEMAMFTNGKTIAMGMTVTLDSPKAKKMIELTPVLVEPGQLPDSIFEIPVGYVLETSVHQEPAAKPGQKKAPPKPAQKKAIVKSPVTRRKE